MIKENQAEFEVLGITKFWEKGYTGKGINIGNTEKAYTQSPHFHGKVFAPTGHVYSQPTNDHGNHTAFMIHEVAYDSDIYCLDMGFNNNNGIYSGILIEKTIPLIKEKNISVINSSSWKVLGESIIPKITKDLRDSLVMCAAAGNISYEGLQGYALSDIWLAVGATGYRDKDSSIYKKTYSSCGVQLDYTCFSGLFVKDFRPDYPDRIYQIEGTSFSSPTFVGMCALVQQLFLEKTGQTLNQYQMENFIKDHLVDLGDLGWDDEYGHGLFVLPDPNTINVGRYVSIIKPLEPPKEEVKLEFTDITKDRWSYEDIKLVSDMGIMNGYPDGTFQPKGIVNREEMATIIARIIKKYM